MNTGPSTLQAIEGSFRDPSGQVFLEQGTVVRSINDCYQEHWEAFIFSGLAATLIERQLLVPFSEVPPLPESWKTLQSERLQVISYPYEWCFGQLKDAALHTLLLLAEALQRNMILKDASAYNVQFIGTSTIFIDLLSFEKHVPSTPWQAYLQFCSHFLAPLALQRYTGAFCGRLAALWIDGIPLDIAVTLLPWRARLSPLLLFHIYLHARAQKKYNAASEAREKVKNLSVKPGSTKRWCESLHTAVQDLHYQPVRTEWSEYYGETNYTATATAQKKVLVDSVAAQNAGNLAIDLGANTGEYSEILSRHFRHVIAADMDHGAVQQHYAGLKKRGGSAVITPLVFDLLNPSPAIGFANKERLDFVQRHHQADMLAALALIHHLTLRGGIPLKHSAGYFSSLLNDTGILLLEFVPCEDSQVKRILAARTLVFSNYTIEGCLEAFSEHFRLEAQHPIPESCRTLLVLRKHTNL